MATIDRSTYDALRLRLEELSERGGLSPALQSDIDLVRDGVTAQGDTYTITGGEDAIRAAIGRLLADNNGETAALGRRATIFSTSAIKISSQKLYERLPALQEISDESFATPEEFVKTLVALRDEGILEDYALLTLAQAFAASGRFSGNDQTFIRFAGSRDLYDRSPILQSIPDEDLENPEKLISRVMELRPSIIAEQRTARNDEKIDSYALITFVHALAAGERLKGSSQPFTRFAAARDLYDRSPILQSIPNEALEHPERLIAVLVELRDNVLAEQRTVQGNERIDTYALGTLVEALAAGGQLPGDAQPFRRFAGARDLYDRSPTLQGIPDKALESPEELIAKLVGLRDKILAEQRAKRKNEKIESYALSTLVLALNAWGQLIGKAKSFLRFASARDFYDRSEILRGISNEDLATPEKLTAKLVGLRDKILAEQRAKRKNEKIESYALTTLVHALFAGRRIQGGRQSFTRLASARDLYDSQPLLQAIPDAVLADPEELMRTLLALRDRIALQKASHEKGIPGESDLHALGTLTLALHAAGRIDIKRLQKLEAKIGGPFEYFLKRREDVEPEVRKLMRAGIRRVMLHHIDRDRFTALGDPTHVVNDGYIRNIIKWGRWFLTDPDVVVRSLYGGDEIAVMTLWAFPDFVSAVPGDVPGRLENALWNIAHNSALARREAVEALGTVIDYYDDRELTEEESEALRWIRMLRDWNADALVDDTAPTPNGGANTEGTEGSTPETEPSPSQMRSPHFRGFCDEGKETSKPSPKEQALLFDTEDVAMFPEPGKGFQTGGALFATLAATPTSSTRPAATP